MSGEYKPIPDTGKMRMTTDSRPITRPPETTNILDASIHAACSLSWRMPGKYAIKWGQVSKSGMWRRRCTHLPSAERQCYLSSYFTPVADVPSRSRPRSSTSEQLIAGLPSFNLTTVGRLAFPVFLPPIGLAVYMKFPIHVHIHRFLRGYPWIYPYP